MFILDALQPPIEECLRLSSELHLVSVLGRLPSKFSKANTTSINQSPFGFYFPINSPLFLIIFGPCKFFCFRIPVQNAICSARPQPIPIIRVRPKSGHVPNTEKFCLVENSNSFSTTIIYLLFYVIFINTK